MATATWCSILGVVCLISASTSQDLSAAITDRGLSTASNALHSLMQTAVPSISKNVQDVSFSGSSSINIGICSAKFSYGMKNGNLDSISVTQASVWNTYSSGTISAKGKVDAAFSGKVYFSAGCSVCVKIPFIGKKCVKANVGDSIGFSVSVKSLALTVGLTPTTSNGLPAASVSSCQTSIGSVGINFNSLPAIFSTLLKYEPVENKIKGALTGFLTPKACNVLTTEATRINTQLQGIPLTVSIPLLGTLEWGFENNGIAVTSGKVMLKTKGAVVPSGMTYAEVTAQLPASGAVDMSKVRIDRDVTLLLDNTLFNSALFSAAQANIMQYTLPSNLIPDAIAPGSDLRLFASIVCPQFASDVPMKLAITVNPAPTVSFTANGGHITIPARVEFQNANTGVSMLAIANTVTATVTVSIGSGNILTFAVSNSQHNPVIESCGEDINGYLTAIVDQVKPVVSTELEKLINSIGSQGFTLPNMPAVSFNTPSIAFSTNTVAVSTDVSITL